MKKLIAAALVCTTVFFLSCNSTDSNDPKSVLMSFFDALGKKDISAARKLATAESKSMLDMIEMGMKMGGAEQKKEDKYDKSKMEFGDAKIEGDKATIPVKDKNSGETTNYTLKKESGGWKVAFDKSSMMNMGTDKMKEHGDDMNEGMDKMKDSMDSLGGKMKEALDSIK